MISANTVFFLILTFSVSVVAPLRAQSVDTFTTDVVTTMPAAVEEIINTTAADGQSTATPFFVENTTTSTEAEDTATSVPLPGGIFYQVISKGTGPEAITTATRLVHYTLFLPDGRKVESSREVEFPVPFSFTPGEGQAIIGMETGTDRMQVGEKRKLFIPANLAYGVKGHNNIPPNSALVFDVELVGIE